MSNILTLFLHLAEYICTFADTVVNIFIMLYKEWKEIREELGYSKNKISKETGISRAMITLFERGESTISLKNFEKMLKAVKCKLKIEV